MKEEGGQLDAVERDNQIVFQEQLGLLYTMERDD